MRRVGCERECLLPISYFLLRIETRNSNVERSEISARRAKFVLVNWLIG
jgi:hypothetical protein